MPERIYKLQPNRTMHLRGFDGLGAAAAMHSATADSFKVSGVFRDASDFAVLVLYDADNFFEHPSLRYLPDTRFAGLTLRFDVRYSNLMPIDSPKFPTIDWPYLDVIRADGSSARIRLFDHAQVVDGDYTPASARFVVQDNGLKEFDRLTLWYLNFAFDYMVPKVECAYDFYSAGAGTIHSVTVAGVTYSYQEQPGDSSADVAQGIVNALAGSADVTAWQGDGSPELGPANQVLIRARGVDGSAVEVSSTAGSEVYTLHRVGAETVAAALASQINSVNWEESQVLIGLSAVASGATIEITAARPGYDGNMLRMYAHWKNDRLRTENRTAVFEGGSSDATWRVTLDFAALGIPEIRQMWLTFAPPLTDEPAFSPIEWEAEFTNWTLEGPESLRMLQVAGPGSVRIEDTDPRCQYSGNWTIETGFFSGGQAHVASSANDTLRISYRCFHTHDLYLGTSLYTDRGVVGVRLDGDEETDLNCSLDSEPATNTRRLIRSGVGPGAHTVDLRLKEPGFFYFDFLEAAVPSDIPDPLPSLPNLAPALDYSTDHTYKLPPARILWMFDQLGYGGPLNEYLGVFWWNQRKSVNAVLPQASVSFGGQFQPGDQIFVEIGGQVLGKSVLADETPEIIALHFEYQINGTLVGVRAEAQGNVLTITSRSASAAYSFTLSAQVEAVSGSTGTAVVSGSLMGGSPGVWEVDAAAAPALNAGARAWHSDLFRECAATNREIVVAASLELVNPPQGFAAVFPDGQPVETAVGFGALRSTHCAFNSLMLDYQKKVFADVADLMAASGLTPQLQFGEFLWWFFTNWSSENPSGGMAYYDEETKQAALAALGRPLHIFRAPTDDPSVNGFEDANFLRSRLRDYVASLIAHVKTLHPSAQFEVLFPYDVNHPVPAGAHQLGGRLNRYVNFPAEWETKETSGLDRLKMEALDFGAWSRNLDLALTAIHFPVSLGWPKGSIRHLIPVFRAGYPWEKEFNYAVGLGIPAVNLWAFDHICLFNLAPHPARPFARSARFG